MEKWSGCEVVHSGDSHNEFLRECRVNGVCDRVSAKLDEMMAETDKLCRHAYERGRLEVTGEAVFHTAQECAEIADEMNGAERHDTRPHDCKPECKHVMSEGGFRIRQKFKAPPGAYQREP